MNDFKPSVVNANLERVMAVVDKFLVDRYQNVCTCPRCMCDIVAIALNYLPPHYIVETETGKEFGSPWSWSKQPLPRPLTGSWKTRTTRGQIQYRAG